MGSPIYAPDPFQGINEQLFKMLAMKQQQEVQKEQLKLRKQELEQAAAEEQYKRQQAQAVQQFDVSQLLGPLLAQVGQGVNAAYGAPVQQVPQGLPVQQQFARFAQQPGMDRATVLAAAPAAMQQLAEQRKKQEEDKAFDEMERIAAPLWTPEERAGMAAYRQGLRSGLPKESLDALAPATAMEKAQLAEVNQKIATAKDAAEADAAATQYLIDKGYIPPGGTMKDASVWVANLKKDAIDFARHRSLELEKIRIENQGKVLEGDALTVAVGGTTDAAGIAKALTDRYPRLAPGLAMKAAVAARETYRKMRAPANDAQGRAQLVYAPARAAHQNLNELTQKGVAWTANMDDMLIEYAGIPLVGGKEIIGAVAKRASYKSMSPEEKRYFNAVAVLVDARLRPISGAAVPPNEIQNFLNAFVPMLRDDLATKAQKLAGLESYIKVLKDQSGLEDDEQGPGLAAARILLQLQNAQPEKRIPTPVRQSTPLRGGNYPGRNR